MHTLLRQLALVLTLVSATLYEPGPAIANEPPAATKGPGPHMALLLPLDSPSFGRHAEAVRRGFAAAAAAQKNLGLPVVAYSAGDAPGETVAAYRKAQESGARIVIGPLTRNAVSEITAAKDIDIPTLALNVPDGELRLGDRMFVFGLQAETEARQVAQFAFSQGRRTALTLNSDSALVRRIHQAFLDEWLKLGARHHAEFAYSPNPINLNLLRQAVAAGPADMVFLAVDASRTRLVRPYLSANVQVYATSQVLAEVLNGGSGNELNGIRFVDMPWLIAPDHPAVMVYPRMEGLPPSGDFDRLYALGIDAFRIAHDLVGSRELMRIALDGVTGRITLMRDHQFVRELVPAHFADGRAIPFAESKP